MVAARSAWAGGAHGTSGANKPGQKLSLVGAVMVQEMHDSRDRALARVVVSRAIKRGQLKRPKKCSKCGHAAGVNSIGNSCIQAFHHNGYAPEHHLDIIWVCVSCRSKAVWDRRNKMPERKAS